MIILELLRKKATQHDMSLVYDKKFWFLAIKPRSHPRVSVIHLLLAEFVGNEDIKLGPKIDGTTHDHQTNPKVLIS